MIRPWRTIGEKIGYDCGFFKVRVRRSASPETGKEHPFYILSTRPWINVVALTKEGKMILVSQFRHGSEEVGLEIPGGAMDEGDASPLAAAKRELLEETGHRSDDWRELGIIQPNPAILDNTCSIFLARDAVATAGLKLDEAEELEVVHCDPGEIPRMVREGKIRHALVLAALHLYELHRNAKT